MKSSENKEKRASAVKDALFSHLARLANMQDFIISQRTEASLFTISDPRVRRAMLAILVDSREHYMALIRTVPGIEELRDSRRGASVLRLPIKEGETEEEILVHQLNVLKSLEISWELVLKFLDLIVEREFVDNGVYIRAAKLRRLARTILRRHRENIRVIERALKLYREGHIRIRTSRG